MMKKREINIKEKITPAMMRDNVVQADRYDYSTQRPFTYTTFSGEEPLACFIDEMMTKSLTRERWNELLHIKCENATLCLLDNHTAVAEAEILRAKTKRSNRIYNATTNMFVATWRSLGRKPKRAMQQYRKKYANDGPNFLCFLFHNFNGTVAHIVRSSLEKIKNIDHTLEYGFKYNIDLWTTYFTALFLTLAEAGGVDNQEYDKCYDCLTSPPSSIFNSEITVFKHVHHAVNNVDKLLVKSREEYRMLFTNHTWTSSEKSKGIDTDVD